MENHQSATNQEHGLARKAGEFLIGNDLRVTRLGFGTMRTYEMKRNDKGVVTDLVMEEPVKGFFGRLANLFKEDSHAA